jgi:hypothetical protein
VEVIKKIVAAGRDRTDANDALAVADHDLLDPKTDALNSIGVPSRFFTRIVIGT